MYKDKYGKKKQSKIQKALIYKQKVQNKLRTGTTKMDNRYKKLKADKSDDKLIRTDQSARDYGATMGTQM